MSDATNPPVLSFCILTYNRALLLTQILDQLIDIRRAFPEGMIEIVVSDNSSTDNTVSLIRQRYTEQEVRLVVQETNIGISRNWLAAIQQTRGIYVWPYADDDLLDVPGVIDMIANHLMHRTADFYRVNVVAGYYSGNPRKQAMLAQIGHGISCDIIFPDLAAMIPYCGLFLRGIVCYGNILLGEVIRRADFNDFLPLDGLFDQIEVMIRLFRNRRVALLHRCLMLLLTPQQGPRWLADAPEGLPGTYIFSIEMLRRAVRIVDNGTLHPGLIDADGLLKVEKRGNGNYVTTRRKLPHFAYHHTMEFFKEYPHPLERRDWLVLEAFAEYLLDPPMKMLFQALARFARAPDQAQLARLWTLWPNVMVGSVVEMWHASTCEAFDKYVGLEIDLSHLGVQDAVPG